MSEEPGTERTKYSDKDQNSAKNTATSDLHSSNNTDETSTEPGSRKRNAFSTLMAPKPKQIKTNTPSTPARKPGTGHESFRSGLLAYIQNPSAFPSSIVLRVTEDAVLIRDLFPKALVHLLLIPRNETFHKLTPFDAFNPSSNASFLEMMRKEAMSAAKLGASELLRLVSPHSQMSMACEAAMNSFEPETGNEAELPPARDFEQDIHVGIHAEPSMDTLHIHIISTDMYSERLKHKKHYNSFKTRFFVPLADFPLDDRDERMNGENQEAWVKGDMKCWRCGKNFGNKFKELKAHLEQEYLEWRKV